MTDFPQPLTPADSDLRGFDNLQLDVDLLPKSKLAHYAEAEAFRAAVLLWCEAWKRTPAASLPDDDLELRIIVGLQRDPETWERIKKDALHKFIKCSDGRLYHEVLAEKANEAWKARLEYRARGRAGAEARAEARAKAAAEAAATAAAEAQVQQVEGEGEVEGIKRKEDAARKRACRLSADFEIPDDWVSWAVGRGHSREATLREFQKMRNWSQYAKNGACRDWFRRFQNWMAEAPKDILNDQRNRNNSNGKPAFSGVVANLREMLDHPEDHDPGGGEPLPHPVLIAGGR